MTPSNVKLSVSNLVTYHKNKNLDIKTRNQILPIQVRLNLSDERPEKDVRSGWKTYGYLQEEGDYYIKKKRTWKRLRPIPCREDPQKTDKVSRSRKGTGREFVDFP